jgi:hypothetical protein
MMRTAVLPFLKFYTFARGKNETLGGEKEYWGCEKNNSIIKCIV